MMHDLVKASSWALPLASLFANVARTEDVSYIYLDNTAYLANASNVVEISWPALQALLFSVTTEDVKTNVAAISYGVPPSLMNSDGFPKRMDPSWYICQHYYQDLKSSLVKSWGSFESETGKTSALSSCPATAATNSITGGTVRDGVSGGLTGLCSFNCDYDRCEENACVCTKSASAAAALPTRSGVQGCPGSGLDKNSYDYEYFMLFSFEEMGAALMTRPPPGDDHRDALRGHRLPTALGHWVSACVIHGIRHNEAFAMSEPVRRLCSESDNNAFSRARNARLIMSNTIPEMTTDDDKPYCIWYPDVASEGTYRELAKRYPDMRYVVGRACAVAGYAGLYDELGLLPEISIAEEARDNFSKDGSKAIFDTIMRQPVCYAILDDYTRSSHPDSPSSPAFMNGDTAVRSSLDVRLGLDKYQEWGKHYFNIAEDCNIDETSSEKTNNEELSPEHIALFYTPLLSHLPTTNKDPLILMAAYEGNIERYVRLRRPKMLHDEHAAVIRGIYHNTTFAKWWSLQEIDPRNRAIKTAILARSIMVNDLSHITPSSPGKYEMPAMIWWPLIPAEETLKELVRRRPDMKLQVAMACIAGDYRVLWEDLAPQPCSELWDQARQTESHNWQNSPNRNYYVDYLEQRAKELGRDIVDMPTNSECEDAAVRDKEPTTRWLDPVICGHDYALMDSNPDGDVYSVGGQANAASWELFICSSEEMRRLAREENGLRLYDD
ncbi:hypothetical protein CORC01_01594 [Colletotrichum orchidophilum]|uniref:Uncharacterized protein n=1 Tax=Colletotrichum orchidophilum TaxID=1209926 RepID=A0A1G4BP20_9PEZI|nr:uncharacterized protein CORC01_01594 [Colletotrichum orchidophilum]OHF03210.1 hypothetical protein CORC01_01594 [Colletotrichum orchidophilum]